MMLRLHNYFRSSTSVRVRAALNLKGLEYEYVAYALRKGETRTPEYLRHNPQALVPTLELEDGTDLTQSLAIIEWLDEAFPTPRLLPPDALGRQRVRALSSMIACEIHPLNNLRVLQRLQDQFGADEEARRAWFTFWVTTTFEALEAALSDSPANGRYCHGDDVTMADLCLYAQVWNNRRFGIATESWPVIARVFDALDAIPALRNAAPPFQPDAEE